MQITINRLLPAQNKWLFDAAQRTGRPVADLAKSPELAIFTAGFQLGEKAGARTARLKLAMYALHQQPNSNSEAQESGTGM